MDSITQACVGAVVGELFLGKQLGWRAPVWGAIIGTIPDMDVIANPWLELHEQIRWHRGWSHGLLGLLLGTSIGSAWLYWRWQIPWKKAVWVSALVLFFNILVDCLNSYGTQIYEPISDYRLAWNLIFIIDPLFTLPLIAAIILGRVLHWRDSERATMCIIGGISLTVLYTCSAIMNKVSVNDSFEHSMQLQGIQAQQWFSAPTPFNTLYWRAVAQVEGGYYIGYACSWDDVSSIPWVFVPDNQDLVAGKMHTPGVETVVWSSMDYWSVKKGSDGRIILTDIRFGDLWFGRAGRSNDAVQGIWLFALQDDGTLERTRAPMRDISAVMDFLWDRIRGRVGSNL